MLRVGCIDSTSIRGRLLYLLPGSPVPYVTAIANHPSVLTDSLSPSLNPTSP